jgi:hypothetical protein
MLGPDLGKNDGDGLRVFVLEIVGEHLFLHVGELLPITYLILHDYFGDLDPNLRLE